MICKICNKEFIKQHFNQRYCSEECRHIAKRNSQKKYKKTEKGKASNQKWIQSERRKENEKRYRQNPIAKHKAVLRVKKYLQSNSQKNDKTEEEYIEWLKLNAQKQEK